MHFSRSIIATALLGLAVAFPQAEEVSATESLEVAASSTGAEAVPAPTGGVPGGAMVATHVVQVGGPNGTLAFYPDNVQANVGDMIQFQFNPKVSE